MIYTVLEWIIYGGTAYLILSIAALIIEACLQAFAAAAEEDTE